MDLKKAVGRFKGVGKIFAFEAFIELYYDEIVNYIRIFLGGVTPQDIGKMVAEGIAPPVPEGLFGKLRGYEEFLQSISPQRLFEAINDARPDLAITLAETGDAGVDYIVKLKQYLMAQVKGAEGVKAEEEMPERESPKEEHAPEKLYKVTCSACGKSAPVTKEEFEAMKVCPFCGVAKEEQQED